MRRWICLMTLGLALLAGGCSSSDEETIPNLAGTWKMIANVTFQFDLLLTQNGGTITGTMARTNGVEPTDAVNGTIDANGAVTFTRARVNQSYVGAVSTTAGITSMNGTFSTAGSSTVALWQATKI